MKRNGCRKCAGQHVQKGRLARTVGPDDANRFTRGNREVDLIEDGQRTEALRQLGAGEKRISCIHYASSTGARSGQLL